MVRGQSRLYSQVLFCLTSSSFSSSLSLLQRPGYPLTTCLARPIRGGGGGETWGLQLRAYRSNYFSRQTLSQELSKYLELTSSSLSSTVLRPSKLKVFLISSLLVKPCNLFLGLLVSRVR